MSNKGADFGFHGILLSAIFALGKSHLPCHHSHDSGMPSIYSNAAVEKVSDHLGISVSEHSVKPVTYGNLPSISPSAWGLPRLPLTASPSRHYVAWLMEKHLDALLPTLPFTPSLLFPPFQTVGSGIIHAQQRGVFWAFIFANNLNMDCFSRFSSRHLIFTSISRPLLYKWLDIRLSCP